MEPIIFTHKACLDHHTGPGHPERPERLRVVLEALRSFEQREARAATLPELALCHSEAYIALVKREIEAGNEELSTGDVRLSRGSWEAALRAAGAVLDGVDAAVGGRNSFCAVRPPGHHAERGKGMGFCLFNNVAIGARYAQKKYGMKRILIVDWDVHHGNGTEEIFAEDPSVFYFSTHQHPLYPGTGLASNEHISNVPISSKKGSRLKVLEAFSRLPELMQGFQPELTLISAGFDAHSRDPLGGLDLEGADFAALTDIVKPLAPKLVSVLEGGYDLIALAESSRAHVEHL
jgi:acetoin utilization deacetylase AcuC-like enzyme